jgi:hypothetical protein
MELTEKRRHKPSNIPQEAAVVSSALDAKEE